MRERSLQDGTGRPSGTRRKRSCPAGQCVRTEYRADLVVLLVEGKGEAFCLESARFIRPATFSLRAIDGETAMSRRSGDGSRPFPANLLHGRL